MAEAVRDDRLDDAADEFEVGEAVVIREDFHSKSFRGVAGTIEGPAVKGGPDLPLWPVKIPVEPYRLMLHAKYLRRKSDAPIRIQATTQAKAQTNGAGGQSKSFFTRLIPWKK